MSRRTTRFLTLAVTTALMSLLAIGGIAVAAATYDATNADKVDGKHAVNADATVTARKGKLVATSPTTGRLPNNIIAKAPDADRLDGRDHTAFAKVDAFYTIYELVPGDAFADAVYAGNWIAAMYCGVGDVAISMNAFEVSGQALRGTEVDQDYGLAIWDHEAVSSDLDMSLRCLDTNGDGPGPLTATQSESTGLSELVEP